MIKHEIEIRKIFSDAFRESWMDDNDFEEFMLEVVKQTGYSFEKMSHDIDIGIENGYSISQQSKLIINVLNALK